MKKWIQTLSNKDRESFLEFCKKASSPIQIYLFARFLGFQGTVVECNEWSTKEFKKQMQGLKYLRDFKHINYHEVKELWYPTILRVGFKLKDIVNDYNVTQEWFYKWMINKDLCHDPTLPRVGNIPCPNDKINEETGEYLCPTKTTLKKNHN